MLKIERYSRDSIDEPAACFASDEEIEIADRLRRRLEELYLGASTTDGRVPGDSSERH